MQGKTAVSLFGVCIIDIDIAEHSVLCVNKHGSKGGVQLVILTVNT